VALKVLLADDSMIAQNMGKKILTDAGYDVIGVSNGAAAVKKLAEFIPDIVLLDVYMPGYSGLEVCERIKNSPVTAQVPVLLTVGKLEPFRSEEGMKVKADGVIVKPFEATDLITVVGKLAERVAGAAPTSPMPTAPVVPAPKLEAVPVQPAKADESEHRAAPIEVPREIAATPAFMTEADIVSPRAVKKPAPAKSPAAIGPPSSQQPKPELAKSVAAGVPAFEVNEATPVYSAPASIPILPIKAEPIAAPEPPVAVATAEPQVEFSAAPTPPPLPIPVEPELEPTILQQPIELQVAADPTLITDPLESGTQPSWDSQTPELRIESGGEEPSEFSGFDSVSVGETETGSFGQQLEAAGDYGAASGAFAGVEAASAASSLDEQPAEAQVSPLEIRFESLATTTEAEAVLAAEPEEHVTPAGTVRVSEPMPHTPPAPPDQTFLDDHIDRALHAVLASVGNQPENPPAKEVPRGLDDIDEALGAAPQRSLEDYVIEEPETETEFVMPPKEERIDVSFGPDVRGAKEIVEPPAPVARSIEAEPKPSVSALPVSAPAAPLITRAPAAEPTTPHRKHVEVEAVAGGQSPKTQQARRETKPEIPVSAARTEVAQAVDNALAAVNETIAEQVVDRVLQRVRRELIDDVKRLLKDA
jgi:CheY-like chemotaxis protein